MLIHNFVDFYVESIWANCLNSCRYQWVLGWTKLENIFVHSNNRLMQNNLTLHCKITIVKKSSQFSAMDVSVRALMKGAAKCDKHCELQNSANRQDLERILCSGFHSEHACFSVYALHSSQTQVSESLLLAVSIWVSGGALALLRLLMERVVQFRPAY